MKNRAVKFAENLRAYALTLDASSVATIRGWDWYARQRGKILDLASRTGRDADVLANALAVLSPSTNWGLLLRDFPRFLDDAAAWTEGSAPPRIQAYGRNRTAACQILHGAPIASVTKGPKVLRFAGNLRSGGNDQGVTIDRHSIALCRGERIGQGAHAEPITLSEYLDAELAHRALAPELADILPMLRAFGRDPRPPQAQALLWTCAVGEDGRTAR